MPSAQRPAAAGTSAEGGGGRKGEGSKANVAMTEFQRLLVCVHLRAESCVAAGDVSLFKLFKGHWDKGLVCDPHGDWRAARPTLPQPTNIRCYDVVG